MPGQRIMMRRRLHGRVLRRALLLLLMGAFFAGRSFAQGRRIGDGTAMRDGQTVPVHYPNDFIHCPTPYYPLEARRRGEAGRGVFRLEFRHDGRVRRIVILQSTHSKLLDAAATESLGRWETRPGKFSTATFPVTFRLGQAMEINIVPAPTPQMH